jgi:post-segregation antitoxin (ccd killing protein)
VCTARVNVYLPDELAARARAMGLNVSAVTRSALEAELSGHVVTAWLDRAAALPSLGVEHDEALAALDAAREELAADPHG